MKRLLITGASGFIGRHVVELARARFGDVHAITSRALGAQAGVVWHQADLLRAEETRQVLERLAPTHLLHLAWTVTPGAYWTSASNLDWLSASLELGRAFAAAGGQRMVCAGTCAEYDWAGGILSENTTPLAPTTLYGAAKLATGQVLEAFCRQVGVSFAWGRVFFTYGPFEHPDRLVSSIARALSRGEPAECTSGTQLRDFLYVEDLARAFVELLDSPLTGPVNLASGQEVAVRDIAAMLGRIGGRPDLVRLGARPMPEGEPERIVADVRRLGDELGFKAEVDLAVGLERTVTYWRQATLLEVPQ